MLKLYISLRYILIEQCYDVLVVLFGGRVWSPHTCHNNMPASLRTFTDGNTKLVINNVLCMLRYFKAKKLHNVVLKTGFVAPNMAGNCSNLNTQWFHMLKC